ncbi:hypothetical protein Tco_1353596 [Tanacetum coccineum]
MNLAYWVVVVVTVTIAGSIGPDGLCLPPILLVLNVLGNVHPTSFSFRLNVMHRMGLNPPSNSVVQLQSLLAWSSTLMTIHWPSHHFLQCSPWHGYELLLGVVVLTWEFHHVKEHLFLRDDKDKDEEPSVGSNRGSKRRRAGKEPESTSAPKEKTSKTSNKSYEGSKSKHKTADESAQTEESMHPTKYLEEPAHQEFKTGVTKDQPNEETPQFPDWFQRPTKLPSPDRDWNKTLPDAHGSVQP